ncbi:hypothetical protein [Vibrio breoganii]|uniref:hypothetical protein n=1 Tax=Vibrio breoganii TaxID=553239 RepID=UPI000C85088A|nr:hypothetical protein [Vibrio breoganii]PML13958.1 hypothetical protein BCT84_12420 [Vibrio breoganii]
MDMQTFASMDGNTLIEGIFSGDFNSREALTVSFKRALIWHGADLDSALAKANEISSGSYRKSLQEGDRFVTLSGRITSPLPRCNYKSEKRNAVNIQTWLKVNAIAEAESGCRETMLVCWTSLNPNNWSRSDGDMCHQFLFGDVTGRIANRRIINN